MLSFAGIKELWKRLVGRPDSEDLDEEIKTHLQLEIDAKIEEGMTPEEARYAAQRKFGNTLLFKERAEEVWRFAWLDSVIIDIRYALRGFRNSPGFALTVIGTLALGLGVLATCFTVFNATVLRPFSVRDPYSLYAFKGWAFSKAEGAPGKETFNRIEFLSFRRENPAFSEVAGYQPGFLPIEGRAASIQAVTGNYFALLGGRTCMGRPLIEGDDTSGESLAVASYTAWKYRFGADPEIIGRAVQFGKSSMRIIGITCPEFSAPQVERVDFWVSLALSKELGKTKLYGIESRVDLGGVPKGPPAEFPKLNLIGRIKPGMTRGSAEAALLAYGRQSYLAWSTGDRKRPELAMLEPRATLIPLDRDSSVLLFIPIFVLFGLVLLIACANVSNMMLARGLARRCEIGIRISLGAGRARMIRQFLTESLLLAIPAALAAFGVAHLVIRIAFSWLSTDILPSAGLAMANIGLSTFLPDLQVLAFLLVSAFAATLVFGLVPAVQTTRLTQANRGEFEGSFRSGRLRNTLVMVQATLCAMLLILAGVAVRNEMRLALPKLGLDIRGVFLIETSFGVDHRIVLESLSSIPAVESTGSCIMPPLMPGMIDFFRPEFFGKSGMAGVRCAIDAVSPEFFDVYKIAVRGRKVSSLDAINAGPMDGTEAVISETAARRLWPSTDALGQTIETRVVDNTGKTTASRFPVVGIAGDSVFDVYDQKGKLNRSIVYFLTPPARDRRNPPNLNIDIIAVRMKGDPDASRRLLEKTLEELTPEGMYFQVLSPQDQLDRFLYPYRTITIIGGFLGALALLLTTSGIFGMLSFVITQRKRELGIRIALGAGKTRVTGMVLRQSLALVAAGCALGALIALGVAKLLSHFTNKVEFFDAGGYVMGVLLVVAAALAASWIPAKRAVNVDPARTLHCE